MSETTTRVVIVGAGVMGAASGRALAAKGNRVSFVDSSEQRCDELRALGLQVSADLELPSEQCIVMICVPTPANEHGFNLAQLESAVRSVGRQLLGHRHRTIVVIRSTIPPGTCAGPVKQWLQEETGAEGDNAYEVAHVPEFLRQASAFEDAANPRVTVIGAAHPATLERLVELVVPFGGDLEITDSTTTAELIKCAHNAYNAAKISFWNEIHAIATAHGVESFAVSNVVSRTAEASWNPAYGIRGGRPYGGSCLPKDVIGLAHHAVTLGVEPIMLAATDRRNRLTSSSD